MIQTLVDQIEAKLEWGSGKDWSNKDFELLSEKVFDATKKRLSVTTLKRIWGRAELVANPSPATLDILSEFVGNKNWREFVATHGTNQSFSGKTAQKNYLKPIIVMGTLTAIVVLSLLFWPKATRATKSADPIDKSKFAFSSKVISDEMPNSVVFAYDASAASDSAKVEIQQSWDKRKRITIKKEDSIATSIYYLPGFFKSKLVVDGIIVKEHDVFIKTKDWLGTIGKDDVPIYLPPEEMKRNGELNIDSKTLEKYNLDPRVSDVITNFFLVKDFGSLYTDNFEMTLKLKNIQKDGLGGCQDVEIFVLYDNGAIGIPLAKKGCISNLKLMAFDSYIDGKKNDLSAFGVSFDDFIQLRCVSNDESFQIFVGNQLAFEMPAIEEHLSIKGISIHFKGAGAVKEVTFNNPEGSVYSFPE